MMEAKDYDYIRYDPGVLDWEFESPLDGLSREEQLNHGRAVVDDVVQSFGPFARPVEAEFNIIDE